MGLALGTQYMPQRFLGRGLAYRACNRDHLRIETEARGTRQIDETSKHIIDYQ